MYIEFEQGLAALAVAPVVVAFRIARIGRCSVALMGYVEQLTELGLLVQMVQRMMVASILVRKMLALPLVAVQIAGAQLRIDVEWQLGQRMIAGHLMQRVIAEQLALFD